MPVLESLVDKVTGLRANFIKKKLTLVFSFQYCQTLKNTYFEEIPGTTVSTN